MMHRVLQKCWLLLFVILAAGWSTNAWGAAKVKMSDADLILAFGVFAGAPGVLLSAALCYVNGVLIPSVKAPWKARFGQSSMALTWLFSMPVPAWIWFDVLRGELKQAATSALIITTPCVLVSVLTTFVAWRLWQHHAPALRSVKGE